MCLNATKTRENMHIILEKAPKALATTTVGVEVMIASTASGWSASW